MSEFKLYSIISNSCAGYGIHRELYKDECYINPFVGACIYNDEQYVDFLERYSTMKYIDMVECKHTPKFIPLPHPIVDPNHPVCTWGCLDIHWIHESDLQVTMETFKRRLERGIDVEPIMIWSSIEMFQGRVLELIKRFLNLPHKSIFVTNVESDLELKYDDTMHHVIYCPNLVQTTIINLVVDFAHSSPEFFERNIQGLPPPSLGEAQRFA